MDKKKIADEVRDDMNRLSRLQLEAKMNCLRYLKMAVDEFGKDGELSDCNDLSISISMPKAFKIYFKKIKKERLGGRLSVLCAIDYSDDGHAPPFDKWIDANDLSGEMLSVITTYIYSNK